MEVMLQAKDLNKVSRGEKTTISRYTNIWNNINHRLNTGNLSSKQEAIEFRYRAYDALPRDVRNQTFVGILDGDDATRTLLATYLSRVCDRGLNSTVHVRNYIAQIFDIMAKEVFYKAGSPVDIETLVTDPEQQVTVFETVQHQKHALIPILRAALIAAFSVGRNLRDAYGSDDAYISLPIRMKRSESSAKDMKYFMDPAFTVADFSSAKHLKKTVVDPMLATGGSAVAAVKFIERQGIQCDQMISMVSAMSGCINVVRNTGMDIYTADIGVLNDVGFILPGLGDAGDRQFEGIDAKSLTELVIQLLPEEYFRFAIDMHKNYDPLGQIVPEMFTQEHKVRMLPGGKVLFEPSFSVNERSLFEKRVQE